MAATAVSWGLRLWVRPLPVPGQAVLARAPAPVTGDLTRLLGAPPVQAPVEVAVVPVDSRFKLLGVVAARAGQASGLALVSVDGKPARAVLVGREVEPGLRLLTVGPRQADFGASAGAPTLTLALPMLAEAARGRLGGGADIAVGAVDTPAQVPTQAPTQGPTMTPTIAPTRPPTGGMFGLPPGSRPSPAPMPTSMPQSSSSLRVPGHSSGPVGPKNTAPEPPVDNAGQPTR